MSFLYQTKGIICAISAQKNAVAVYPNEAGAPETGIVSRIRDLLTPQAEHLKPGT
jgi:hypothetical protein